MKSIIGQTLTTVNGEEVSILSHRKSRTFPFFSTFYLYDILWRGQTLSIRCKELDNLVNGKSVTFVFD